MIFSSISADKNFNLALWNEIYDCATYIGMDMNTLKNMPVYLRKFWISKHNERMEIEKERMEASKKKK